jgi:indole-3-glycerol phosphate synthase
VSTAGDAAALREIGADAVLIGEALMRAKDKRQLLKQLKGET